MKLDLVKKIRLGIVGLVLLLAACGGQGTSSGPSELGDTGEVR